MAKCYFCGTESEQVIEVVAGTEPVCPNCFIKVFKYATDLSNKLKTTC